MNQEPNFLSFAAWWVEENWMEVSTPYVVGSIVATVWMAMLSVWAAFIIGTILFGPLLFITSYIGYRKIRDSYTEFKQRALHRQSRNKHE